VKGQAMVQPLNKSTGAGTMYARPKAIEDELTELTAAPASTWRTKASITNRNVPGYLSSETLLHLIREANRQSDDITRDFLIPILLVRCESNLVNRLRKRNVPRADYLIQEILGQFAELLALDGHGENPHELDFYECRFNRAFTRTKK
jgi:hypothetical protein